MRLPKQKALFPAEKYLFYRATHTDQIIDDLFSQLLAKGNIVDDKVMDFKNLRQPGIHLLFQALCQNDQIIGDC